MIHHTIDSQATLAHPTVGATVVLDRADATNPNRHIWNNNGTWWLHYTLHLADYTKRRVRESLRTRDVEEARRRRDARLRSLDRGGLDSDR